MGSPSCRQISFNSCFHTAWRRPKQRDPNLWNWDINEREAQSKCLTHSSWSVCGSWRFGSNFQGQAAQTQPSGPAVLVEEVLGLAYPACTYNTVIRYQQKQPKTYGTTNKIKVEKHTCLLTLKLHDRCSIGDD